MGEQEPEEEQKKRRADALIGDFISEREELREGPRFHVPPFVERNIEGTRTVIYMPVDAGRLEAPGKLRANVLPAPAQEAEPDTPFSAALEREPARTVDGPPLPPDASLRPAAVPTTAATALTEKEAVPARPAAPVPPPPAEHVMQAPFEFPARLTTGQSGPASFRRMYTRPDGSGPSKPGLQALPRRVSAKDLIARLRVVREGVETAVEAFQRKAEPAVPPAPVEPAGEEPADEGNTALPRNAAAVPPEDTPREARPAPAPPAKIAASRELEQKAEGGKLCPSCGAPISDRNRLLICNGCGKMNCDSCNRYELAHMKSDIYYEYQFDFPLCLQCYGKAFSIQRLLGRAGVCYGNGNYSYALYYANQALEQDPESRYAPRARDIIAKTNKAQEQSQERDKEWRLQRKQFATSRLRQEDPSWR